MKVNVWPGAALLLAIALSTHPSEAWAQAAPSAADVAFQRGAAAMDAHQYQAAALAFEESYDLEPSPVVLYNLGLAHRELGHTRQAIASLERCLRESGSRIPRDRAAAIQQTLGELQGQLVVVTIGGVPSGGAVTVDGRDEALTDGNLVLDAGVHAVVVSATGHQPWRTELRVSPGQRVALDVRLQELSRGPERSIVVQRVSATAPITPHPRQEPSRSITSRWWFWTTLAVVVVGGTVAGIAIANANASPEPPVGGVQFTAATLLLSGGR